MKTFAHAEITGSIIKAYYTVYNTLRYRRGYSEENLQKALQLELSRLGHKVRQQVGVHRTYRGQPIGRDFVDLVVDGTVAVEIKKVSRLQHAHFSQLRTYLVDGPWPVGMLLNFGGKEPEFRRLEKTRLAGKERQ